MAARKIHCCQQQTLIVWVWLLFAGLHLVCTVCLQPSSPAYGYALSETKISYATGFKYEVVCIPSYKLIGSGDLFCQASGNWNATVPTCSPTAGAYPWWLLLIGVVAVMLLVTCIAPRVIHIFVDERHVAHLKSLKVKKGGLDVDLDEPEDKYTGEPLPSSMDVMEDNYGDDIDKDQMDRARKANAF